MLIQQLSMQLTKGISVFLGTSEEKNQKYLPLYLDKYSWTHRSKYNFCCSYILYPQSVFNQKFKQCTKIKYKKASRYSNHWKLELSRGVQAWKYAVKIHVYSLCFQ